MTTIAPPVPNTLSTEQQVATLLYHLEHQTQPPFDMLFWKTLTKINFDYQPISLQHISQLFDQLRPHFNLAQLREKMGGEAFLVAIASYLGNYLAKHTNQPIVWLNHAEAMHEIEQKNQQHGTNAKLPAIFENSLIAKIGNDTFCQPLSVIKDHLANSTTIVDFVGYMTDKIFTHLRVDHELEPNEVCKRYLAKLSAGHLVDDSFAFYEVLSQFEFNTVNPTLSSLQDFNALLTHIQQTYQLDKAKFIKLSKQPNYQRTLLLLGFYAGMLIAKLSKTFVRWFSYEQTKALFGSKFAKQAPARNINNMFVLVLEQQYHLPMNLVVKRLFGKASSDIFTKLLQDIHRDQTVKLTYLGYDASVKPLLTQLPKSWQLAFASMARLLGNNLLRLQQGKVIRSQYLSVDNQHNTAKFLTLPTPNSTDSTQPPSEFEQLQQLAVSKANDQAFFVALCDGVSYLPEGKSDSLMLIIEVYQSPVLSLELMLPYQPTPNFTFFPMVVNQLDLMTALQQQPNLQKVIATTVFLACQKFLKDAKAPQFFQNFYLDNVNLLNKNITALPLQPYMTQWQWATLPNNIIEDNTKINTDKNTPQNHANTTDFTVQPILHQLQPHQRDYLQVMVSGWLQRDILFSQIKAMTTLYRSGRIVWASLVWANNRMFYPEEGHFSGEVVYDPAGKTSLEDLRYYAQKLYALKGTHPTAPDQAIYATHLTSETSRVFELPYPQSLANVSLKISSIWFWREHLPNGMLSDFVFPLIISDDTQGRVMVLPARFWEKGFYQAWLNKANERFGVTNGYDKLPNMEKDELYSSRFLGQGLDHAIFPKFKDLQSVFDENSDKKPANSSVPPAPLFSQTNLHRSVYSQF
ncbi:MULTISPECIES: hypothetical protein [unclassified Moraxella]|uniref:hypothetical protein n=1 Tax=unclassified Moraxella TaxID=2685852 RepID=UPI003AF6C676